MILIVQKPFKTVSQEQLIIYNYVYENMHELKTFSCIKSDVTKKVTSKSYKKKVHYNDF